MPSCPRCLTLTESAAAYCSVCGRPRMVESLRAPTAQPPWQLYPLLALLALWLAITVGVAFLREWKAVRDSRTMLAENHPEKAWDLLKPFVAEHPEHVQGLFLCGQATIRLAPASAASMAGTANQPSLADEAKQCLAKVSALSPETGKQLSDDYRQVLTAGTRGLGCNSYGFGRALAVGDELGAPYTASVLAGLDGVVAACKGANGDAGVFAINALLRQRGLAGELVAQGFVPAIGKALAEARYGDARSLALRGLRTGPGSLPAIDAALDGERRKVGATMATVRQLCQDMMLDPRYRPGGSWCYPEAAPAAVQAAKDAWGMAPVYATLGAAAAQGCHPGFHLDLDETHGTRSGDRQFPAAGLSCRVVSGVETWQLPNHFWLPRESRAAAPAGAPAPAAAPVGGR